MARRRCTGGGARRGALLAITVGTLLAEAK